MSPIDKGYPYHVPSVDRWIFFNCCKGTLIVIGLRSTGDSHCNLNEPSEEKYLHMVHCHRHLCIVKSFTLKLIIWIYYTKQNGDTYITKNKEGNDKS